MFGALGRMAGIKDPITDKLFGHKKAKDPDRFMGTAIRGGALPTTPRYGSGTNSLSV